MTLSKLTNEEYEMISSLHEILHKMQHGPNVGPFFEEKDVTANDFDNVLYDIGNDSLIECISAYKAGTLQDAAHDSDGVGFTVVTIIENYYSNVFGYTENNGEKTFYLCETSDSYNEELERDEIHFFVDDEPVILDDCIRF